MTQIVRPGRGGSIRVRRDIMILDEPTPVVPNVAAQLHDLDGATCGDVPSATGRVELAHRGAATALTIPTA